MRALLRDAALWLLLPLVLLRAVVCGRGRA